MTREERDEFIGELVEEGWSKSDIAELTEISISTVCRVMSKLNITVPASRSRKVKKIPAADKGVPLPEDYGVPLMERVKNVLGDRMTEYYGGYKLDGKPCNCEDLVSTAGLSFCDQT